MGRRRRDDDTIEDFAAGCFGQILGAGLVLYGIYWVIVEIVLPFVTYVAAFIVGLGIFLGGYVSIANFLKACVNNISFKVKKIES